MYKKNHGFTLVEIIVVVVIIAILAAIIIPITFSMIDSSREADAKTMGKSIMTAVQTEFNVLAANDELWYSINGKKGIILNKHRKDMDSSDFAQGDFLGGFINISNTVPVKNILKKIEGSDKIIMLYVGAGNVISYYDGEENYKMYTAYTIVYQLEDSTNPIYFYDGKEITKKWPFKNPPYNKPNNHDGQNFVLTNNTSVKLQLYALKIPDGEKCDTYWKNTVMSVVKEQQ